MYPLAIIRDDRYREHNAGEAHPESPNRLRVIHELLDREFPSLPLIAPRIATDEELALVHDRSYISWVAGTSGKVHTQLDPDTGLSARSYEIACLAAGGLLQGVDSLLFPNSPLAAAGSIFAFVRPPGHHAEPRRGMGFCLFNNAAIAAQYAKQKFGLKRVLIVDWDLHHGNGTQRAFYDDPEVLFFSSHQYPYYPGSGAFDQTGSGAGTGFTVNAPLPPGFGDAEYVEIYDRILKPIALQYRPELILVSAGFDPFIEDPLGGMEVTAEGFGALARIITEIARETCGKVLITLEGGYNPRGLKDGVRSVLNALQGEPHKTVLQKKASTAGQVIQNIVSIHKQFWRNLG